MNYPNDFVNKIINDDCLEVMKYIPENTIDLILTDLPYAITQNEWDSIIPFEPLWKQYSRLIKENGLVVLTCERNPLPLGRGS